MTLSQAAVGMPDQTATPIVSVLQIDGSHLEPRCHVCRNDGVRQTGQRSAGLWGQLRHDPACPR